LRNMTGMPERQSRPAVGSGVLKGELGSNIYRADPSGRVDMMISEEAFGGGGNGIAFSPDYKKVYIVSRQVVWSFDIGPDGKSIRNQKQFADFNVDGIRCATDGIRVDIYGNLWCGSNRRQQCRLQRRDRVESGRQAARANSPARNLRQHLFRRAEAKPVVHDARAVALCGLCQHAGRFAGLAAAQASARFRRAMLSCMMPGIAGIGRQTVGPSNRGEKRMRNRLASMAVCRGLVVAASIGIIAAQNQSRPHLRLKLLHWLPLNTAALRAQYEQWRTQFKTWGKWAPSAGIQRYVVSHHTGKDRERIAARTKRYRDFARACRTARTCRRCRSARRLPPRYKWHHRRRHHDNYQVSYHGQTVAHIDTWCHFFENGQMYNGVPVAGNLNPERGCIKGNVMQWKNGIPHARFSMTSQR
jgi:hypothetical protein